jgi:hypothetical protein
MLYTLIYICLQLYTTMVSHILPSIADIMYSHCFRYISIAIALQQCIIYDWDPFFNVNSTMLFIMELDLPNLVILRIDKYAYAFCTVFQHKFSYNVC